MMVHFCRIVAVPVVDVCVCVCVCVYVPFCACLWACAALETRGVVGLRALTFDARRLSFCCTFSIHVNIALRLLFGASLRLPSSRMRLCAEPRTCQHTTNTTTIAACNCPPAALLFSAQFLEIPAHTTEPVIALFVRLLSVSKICTGGDVLAALPKSHPHLVPVRARQDTAVSP